MNSNINPIFTQPRQPEDTDMVSLVREKLISAGLAKEVIEAFDTDQYIKDAVNLAPEGQRFLLNRFWHIQLINCGTATIEERYCLLDSGDYKEWIRLFSLKILPTAISLRLPKLIQ